jgi:hypothetical protein
MGHFLAFRCVRLDWQTKVQMAYDFLLPQPLLFASGFDWNNSLHERHQVNEELTVNIRVFSNQFFSEVDCQSLYMFNQIMGNFAIGLSSINLSIRT